METKIGTTQKETDKVILAVCKLKGSVNSKIAIGAISAFLLGEIDYDLFVNEMDGEVSK